MYADPSDDHPVTLFINDYNTEQSGKRTRYAALLDVWLPKACRSTHRPPVPCDVDHGDLEPGAALTDMERFNKKQPSPNWT